MTAMGDKDFYTPRVFRANLRNARKEALRIGRPVGLQWRPPGSPIVGSGDGWRTPRRNKGIWELTDSGNYFSLGGMLQNVHAAIHPDGSVEPGELWDKALLKRPKRRAVRR